MQEFGKAGKEGVLVKGANYLDIITKAKAIVLDKTGTITKGNFEVTKIILSEEITEEELLKTAAIAESMSNHPIAKSIVSKAGIKINTNEISKHEEIHGMGIKVKYNEDKIIVGNSKLLESEEIKYYPCNELGAIVYVVKNNKYLGVIVISDSLKEDSIEAIKEIKKNGIENIYMLTGDNEKTSQDISNKVEIENIHFNLLPNEKVDNMKEIKEENVIVVAVGDGINDAPILSLADIGIAIGNTGSDLAIETSDIVIMDGKLSGINKLLRIAKKTRKVVMENIYFAIGIKVLILILGAFGLSTMWWAVFADVGVTFITVLNSLRVLKR